MSMIKQAEKKDIDKIVLQLTNTFVIDQIFLWKPDRDEQTNPVLQILMQKGGGQYFTEANIYVSSLIREYDAIEYVICYPNEMMKKIKQGLGCAALICQPENLIYQNAEPKEKVTTQIADFESVLDRTQSYIAKENNKIQAFREGYEFYFNKENLGLAAFMLHQVIELIFRTAEHLLVCEERRTHCLITHQNYVGKFTRELGAIFCTSEHKRILHKLDQAYSAVRYDQGYKIKKKKLETAYQLTESMLTWLSDYSSRLLREIEQKLGSKCEIVNHPLNNTMMKTTIHTDHRDLILNAMETYCTPTAVRCFAYRLHSSRTINFLDDSCHHPETHQYYLMTTVSVAQTQLANLQSAIGNLLPDFIKIIVLPFETHHFQEKCKKGDPFCIALVKQSETWYENEKDVLKIPEDIHIPTAKQSEQGLQWMITFQKAERLYHALTEDLFFDHPEVTCYGLALALEQTCLGLLRVVWQFQPQSTNLTHLIKLCELICPEATSVFVLDNPNQRQIFKLVVDAQQQFRHNPNYRTQSQYLEMLSENVSRFMDTVHKYVEAYFQKNADGDVTLINDCSVIQAPGTI